MDDVYEFTSLAIVGFPYWFLYFSIDNLEAVAYLLTVKFSYKFGFQIVLFPFSLGIKKLISRVKSKFWKSKVNVNIEKAKDMPKEEDLKNP